MKRFFFAFPCVALAVASHLAGCGGSNTNLNNGGSSSGGSSGGDDGGTASEPPHAVGTVVLGESHLPSGGGTSTPVVMASFQPDSTTLPKSCGTQVAGCTFVSAPVCGTNGTGACNVGETCTWDASCHPKCTAQCTLECGANQECYFPSPNAPACRNVESFDAGALAFAGTTTPITLFPPYQYDSTAQGAPFLAGAQIEVQASGATVAGFAQFDEKFTATTFLQTNPPIDKIAKTTVYGTGAIPISWVPGKDTVTVSVAGLGGVATCTATDSSGAFQIPRAVVTAALGKSSSELEITVTRERDEWHKSEATHGQMTTAKVQPVGWLELTTMSTESASFQGCPVATETMCVDGCYDTRTDEAHCGSCTTVCPSNETCVNGACSGTTTTCPLPSETKCVDGCFDLESDQYHCGSCTTVCASNQTCLNGTCTTGSTTTCTTCESNAATGSCYSQYSTCTYDTQCGSYASCVQGCGTDTTCQSNCASSYPTGYSDFLNYYDCICYTACSTECATECSQGL